MEYELLFAEQKWNILKSLSAGKFSPLQLAEKSQTSMANISQQLRLLEFAHLVKKERIPNRERGKPRVLFSLAQDHAYLISAMNGFAEKKLVGLDLLQKLILRTWYIDDESLSYFTQKFLWSIEDKLSSLSAIVVQSKGDEIHIHVGVSEQELGKKIPTETKLRDSKGNSRVVKVRVQTNDELSRSHKSGKGIFSVPGTYHVIYDPSSLLAQTRAN